MAVPASVMGKAEGGCGSNRELVSSLLHKVLVGHAEGLFQY